MSPRPNSARFAAAGIFLSKISGLVRERVLANLLGTSPQADVWRAALRAANNLQNLLGEQTLSAAFIPIYSRLLEEGREKDAGRFAGAIFGLLVAVVGVLVLFFVALAPWVVTVLTPGFLGDAADVAAGTRAVDRFELLVRAVRITFPMTGILVLSAWALAVLNGHRRFFLSYLAPVLWNGAIVTFLLGAAWRSGLLLTPSVAGLGVLERWLFAGLWGALAGGLLQFLVQLPLVLRLSKGLRPSVDLRLPGVRPALRAFFPALAGRGVVQLGFYVDMFLASFLRTGALAALGFVGSLINLVMGVFGMSVAAAELPELSREDEETSRQRIAGRIERAVRQSLFLVAPGVMGYAIFGFLVIALLFRGGLFGREDSWLVYLLLLSYCVGLTASAVSRLLQNAFFALRDTRTPAVIAGIRLAVAALVAVGLIFPLDEVTVASVVPGLANGEERPLFLGALGLGLASSLGAWTELYLLLRGLRRRLPDLHLPWVVAGRRVLVATLLAAPGLGLWWLLSGASVFLQAALVLPTYAGTYLGVAWLRGEEELGLWLGR